MVLDRVSMDCDSEIGESHFPVGKQPIDLPASFAGLVVLSTSFAIIATLIISQGIH